MHKLPAARHESASPHHELLLRNPDVNQMGNPPMLVVTRPTVNAATPPCTRASTCTGAALLRPMSATCDPVAMPQVQGELRKENPPATDSLVEVLYDEER
jgi:hypothetical protein